MQTVAPANIWQGEHYSKTYFALQNSFSNKKSCIVVTGRKGVGKTTIVNQFVEEFGDDYNSLIINAEQKNEFELYSSIASGFGVGTSFSSKVQFLVEFGNFLYKCNDQQKQVVLVIDDCHRLPQQLLEIIRQVANIEKDGNRLLHLVLVGDSSFDKIINSRKNKPLRLALALHHQVDSFKLKDTAEYVSFRLESVGYKEKVFCLKGIEIVHKACRGIAKKINLLCEHVLAKAESKGGIAVEVSSIYESVEQLGFGDTDPKSIPIEEPEKVAEEKQVFYQTPEEVLAEQDELPALEAEGISEASPESNKKRPVLWIGLVVLLGIAVVASWWFWVGGGSVFLSDTDEVLADKSKIVVPIVPPTQTVDASEPRTAIVTAKLPDKAVFTAEPVAIVKKVVERKNTQTVDANVKKVVTELPELPMFPDNTTVDTNGQEVVIEGANLQPAPNSDESVSEIVESKAEQNEVVKEVAEVIEPAVETEKLTEPFAVQEVLVLPPAKPEPTVLPLEPGAEELSAKELLAETLITSETEKESVVPAIVVELDGISKRKPEQQEVSQVKPINVVVEEKAPEMTDYPKDVVIFRLEPDSSELTDYYKKKFKEFVKLAQEHPDLSIQVRGYVSSDNDTDENLELSRKRALQVYKMLLDNGVEFTRVQVIGMGVKDPIMSNATPQGRYKNRRVEVEFVVDDKS